MASPKDVGWLCQVRTKSSGARHPEGSTYVVSSIRDVRNLANTRIRRLALPSLYEKDTCTFDRLLIHRRFLSTSLFLPHARIRAGKPAEFVLKCDCQQSQANIVRSWSQTCHSRVASLCGTRTDSQCFPLYTYDEDGTNRRDKHHRVGAGAVSCALWRRRASASRDIFHYVYGLLHHPGYRKRHADSLKPRTAPHPPRPGFRGLPRCRQASWRGCTSTMNASAPGNWTGKRRTARWTTASRRCARSGAFSQKTATTASSTRCSTTTHTLTLRGIPAEAFRYRLGTRSALEWVVDQYRVKTDKRSGIVSDPNAWSDDQQYIVNLAGPRPARQRGNSDASWTTWRALPLAVAIAARPHAQSLVPTPMREPCSGSAFGRDFNYTARQSTTLLLSLRIHSVNTL